MRAPQVAEDFNGFIFRVIVLGLLNTEDGGTVTFEKLKLLTQ
jgi:hypothetical protein